MENRLRHFLFLYVLTLLFRYFNSFFPEINCPKFVKTNWNDLLLLSNVTRNIYATFSITVIHARQWPTSPTNRYFLSFTFKIMLFAVTLTIIHNCGWFSSLLKVHIVIIEIKNISLYEHKNISFSETIKSKLIWYV